MRWLRVAPILLVAVACGPGGPDEPGNGVDGGDANLVPDSGCECTPSQASRRTQESACGDYEQTRSCDGCMWLEWTGDAPNCACNPGELGKEREVAGGDGCAKGVRTEREVCNDDGSGYVWMAVSEFDGSRVDCIAGANEERQATGACGVFIERRSCDESCKPSSWVGTDDSCACEYQGGSNWRECAMPQGPDCGWQYCSPSSAWYPCATNPNRPERCQPGSFCIPICKAGDVEACQGETVTLPCEQDRFKRCTCESDGRFACSLSCFG